MQSIIFSANNYVGYSLGLFSQLSGGELFLMLWPFLLLSIPRYLITEVIVLLLSNKSDPAKKIQFRRKLHENPPLVSVLLPGYNERNTLETTVLALREQTYPNMEIIVVNDGSSDGMEDVARNLSKRGLVRYFEHKIRGGKSSAANFALEAARGEYIVICDADSTFDRDSIWYLLQEFYRDDVYAVAGNLRVRNAEANLLTRLQALQYVLSIGIGRRVSSFLGVLFIVSGAFGAMRKSALKSVGGWDSGPGEDADVAIKLRLAGAKIAFAPDAICMTDAPDSWWGFFRQQMRWNRSTIRFRFRKYKSLFSPTFRRFSVSNLLASVDEILFQVVLGISFPIYLVWLYTTHQSMFWPLMLAVFLLYTAVNYLHLFIALHLSDRPWVDIKYIPYIPLYGLFMGIYMRAVRILAYADEYIFRSSYWETFVPENVQKQTRIHDSW